MPQRCDICSAELPAVHAHLFEPAGRQLTCACAQCMISVGNQAGSKYRRVPERARNLAGFQLSDAQWEDMLIPVGMAFFFYNTPAARVLAFYPSPAGATESLLPLESWAEIVRANPVLETMEPDVEALLVNRIKGAQEYFIAPVDKCYELVGLIRMHWRGLSGGTEVWQAIAGFFDGLKARSLA